MRKKVRDQRYERRIVAKVLKKFKVLLKEKALFFRSMITTNMPLYKIKEYKQQNHS